MANKKNTKKEIKDSIDVHDIVVEKKKDEVVNEGQNQKIKYSFIDFINEKRIPIYTYCRKLFKSDLKRMKEDPNGLSEDTLFIKDVSNKKRFILKTIYLVSALLIAIILFIISVLLLVGVIGSFNQSVAENFYIPGILMAFSIVIFLFFI